MSTDRKCGTCRHAVFATTPKGNYKKRAATCTYVVPWPPLPWAVTGYLGGSLYANPPRVWVWPDTGEGCPTWEPKE